MGILIAFAIKLDLCQCKTPIKLHGNLFLVLRVPFSTVIRLIGS